MQSKKKMGFVIHVYRRRILGNSTALTSIVVTELANTIKCGGGGSYITLFSPSSHSKQFPVTSLRFTEYMIARQAVVYCGSRPTWYNDLCYWNSDGTHHSYQVV